MRNAACDLCAGMEIEMRWEKELSFGKLTVEWTKLGEDYMLTVWGGEAPHIGCTVLAVPRRSLTGDGTSATSSVINRTGHKDEVLCRRLAERVAAEKGAVVCCAGGVHQDGITGGQIAELLAAADTFSII